MFCVNGEDEKYMQNISENGYLERGSERAVVGEE
jgi:hypothetical protein